MKEIFETIDRCRICGTYDLVEILNLGEQPPANSLYEKSGSKPQNVPLRLMFCEKCSTVQLGEDVDLENCADQTPHSQSEPQPSGNDFQQNPMKNYLWNNYIFKLHFPL